MIAEQPTVPDPLATEGRRLAVALLVAGLRDDLVACGLLLEPFPESIERSALISAVSLLADQVKHNALASNTPMEEIIKIFSAGLLGLG